MYAADDGSDQPVFYELPPPETEDVARVTTLVGQRVQALLKRRGFDPEDRLGSQFRDCEQKARIVAKPQGLWRKLGGL